MGDIHGRTNWHSLVEDIDENTVVIFVGDYTDPYTKEGIGYPQMLEQLKQVVAFKKAHPDNVVLLYGNHDLQYVLGRRETNRYDKWHAGNLYRFFKENAHLFDVMYQIGEKYLISHAGLTKVWYEEMIGPYEPGTTLSDIVRQVNNLWKTGHEMWFSNDFSPVWVRPYELLSNNIFGLENREHIQVVGHTSLNLGRVGSIGLVPSTDKASKAKWKAVIDNPDATSRLIMVDCLDEVTDCFEIQVETSSTDEQDS